MGVFSFRVKGQDSTRITAQLEESYGVMTRVGLHCAPSAHRAMGTFPEGTIRASIGYHTSGEEIDHFLRSLKEISYA